MQSLHLIGNTTRKKLYNYCGLVWQKLAWSLVQDKQCRLYPANTCYPLAEASMKICYR